MLERIKSSLRAVSHDRTAFEARLRQGLSVLPPRQRHNLKLWCFWLYGECYFTVICQCFADLNLITG